MSSDETWLVDGPDEFADCDIDSRRELIDVFLRSMSLESLFAIDDLYLGVSMSMITGVLLKGCVIWGAAMGCDVRFCL